MDQTFFIFIILFAVLIVYLFQQKQQNTIDKQKMVENLTNYIDNTKFDDTYSNTIVKANSNNIADNSVTNNVSGVGNEYGSEQIPEPSNNPTANGYETNLIFAHPDKINNCNITNLAPMNYYSEINQKLNGQLKEKVMNGGTFGDVTGYADDEELFYY